MAAAPTDTDDLNGDSQRKKENCLGIDFNNKDKKTDMDTSSTTTAEMAGAGSATSSHLEDICNSCLKPMLSCACKRIRRTNVVTRTTIDDTPMEDVEEVSTRNHTTAGNNIIPPPGLPTASASTAVHPQTVQDPLHTGLAQSVQTASSSDNTSRFQTSRSTLAAPTIPIESYDPQRMYEYYIEDELSRNGELIMAAHTTLSRTQVPSWQTLSTATETAPIRLLLAALAFDLGTTDPWNTLGLSRLEGPKPNTHMLQSRRDVAMKIIDSCTPALHDRAHQEMATIKINLAKACDECCNNLDNNEHERRNLKGTTRNIPRWMEPPEDMLEYLATHVPTNGRIALHLSNLGNTDFSNYQTAIDVNTSRQLHSHLCGSPDEIEWCG